MRISLNFNERKDADIIEYLKDTNRTYKIREAIRKAIKFDDMIASALAKGLGAENPKHKADIIEETNMNITDDEIVSDNQEISTLSEDEINKRIDQF